jgi:hypothetical protein
VGRRGGELGPEFGSGVVGIRLVASLWGLVRMVPRRAVMVGMPELDGRFVKGNLLQGGVRPTEPRQGRNGWRNDHEQRQDARGHRPRVPESEERTEMERPS